MEKIISLTGSRKNRGEAHAQWLRYSSEDPLNRYSKFTTPNKLTFGKGTLGVPIMLLACGTLAVPFALHLFGISQSILASVSFTMQMLIAMGLFLSLLTLGYRTAAIHENEHIGAGFAVQLHAYLLSSYIFVVYLLVILAIAIP